MSRCFPFPPPGYEKKAETDEVDLIKKEKQREKKHKKEKDKEKREGKEKREKGRSDGKHREKNDKKDKEKDGDKDKDKKGSSDDKKLLWQSEGLNGDRQIRKEERDRYKNIKSDEKRFAGKFADYNEGKLSQSFHLPEEIKDSKFVQELGKQGRDEVRESGNMLFEKFTGADREKDVGMVSLLAKGSGTWVEGKEKNKDKRVDVRKMDRHGIRDEASFGGNAVVENSAGIVQTGVGVSKPQEKAIEGSMEEKEKTREKESDDKQREKRKDREKKSRGKDKEIDKEKKKEEKAKEKSEHKNTKQDKSKESSKNDLIVTPTIKARVLPMESSKSATSIVNLGKRKDSETNGVLQVNGIKANKLPRPTSSHPLTENGRILEPCQTTISISSDRQITANDLKVDNKEQKLNGVIDVQPFRLSSSRPLSATVQADQIAEASVKLPHPDSKYLCQVLSVPKMEEWSDFDDQEWLFSSNQSKSKKTKVQSYVAGETLQIGKCYQSTSYNTGIPQEQAGDVEGLAASGS